MGASAGGIEACCIVFRHLPADLPASVLIAQHVGRASELADVLAKCGPLKVATASDDERLVRRKAYVAPSDQHLLVEHGRVKVSRGPRENRQRPSVDVLFRSAARIYRSRVIAVILSGALDDGSAGVFAVKQRGGVVVVQDPRSARFPSMPENALRAAKADYCLPVDEIAAVVIKLVHEGTAMPKRKKMRSATRSSRRVSPDSGAAPFVCPECSGPLFQDREGPPGQLACLVGHSFAPESLSEAHRDALERALLTTMRLLQERAGLHKHLASATLAGGNGRSKERFQECAESADKDVALLREILERI